MFIKANWKVWLIMIIVAIVITFAPTTITKIKEQRKAESTYDTFIIDIKADNLSLKNRISGKIINVNGKNLKIIVNSENPDLIIAREKKEITGYSELENYLYVPYIMVANPNLRNNSQSCFYEVNGEGYLRYSKDIRYILSAIETGKTWKEMGFEEDSIIGDLNEPVTLVIQAEYDNSYDDMKKYFMLALNDFKVPTKMESADLEARANAILSKCVKTEDISYLFNQNKWFKDILFVPESVISENLSSFKKRYTVISPGKTMRSEYSTYVKSEKNDEIKEIIKSKEFLELTGFRNKDYNNILDSKYYKSSFEIFDFIDTSCIELQGIVSVTESLPEETVEETKVEETENATASEETEEGNETDESQIEESNETEDSSTPSISLIIFLFIVIGAIIISFLPY
ncbi:hypothetical protein [Hungatella hathewayi]|uniref:hypothetical protein n=1 Tax=Hungatella hathewayi TaxID=154046 RepID=UPI003562D74C